MRLPQHHGSANERLRARSGVVGRATALGVVVLSGAPGCVSSVHTYSRPLQPASEAIRARIASVTVRAKTVPDSQVVEEPWRKSNAAGRGAAAGAVGMIAAGAQSGGWGMLLGVFLSPVGAVVGAVAGHASAMEDTEAETRIGRIIEGFKSVRPGRSIAEQIGSLARSDTGLQASVVYDAESKSTSSPQAGVVLEFAVEAFGLRGPSDVDPDLTSFIIARGRLCDAVSGILIQEWVWDRSGGTRTFKEWSDAGVSELHSEYQRLETDIARAAVDEMFRMVVVP